MALGILLSAFIVMCVVSGVGFALLLLLKNEKAKKMISIFWRSGEWESR